MEVAKKQRRAIKGQLTRFSRARENEEGLEADEVESRLAILDDIWKNYQNTQVIIDNLMDADADDEEELDYKAEMIEKMLITRDTIKKKQKLEVTRVQTKMENTEKNEAINLNFAPIQEEENFSNFIHRLDTYMFLKNIKESMKVYVFLQALTPGLHQKLYELIAPEDPKLKSYKQLVSIMQAYLEPLPSKWALQHTFIERTQMSHESVIEFSSQLRKLALNCKFFCDCGKSISDNFLSLQLIRGLNDSEIRTKLLQETRELEFKEIVALANNLELGKKENKLMGNLPGEININRMSMQGYITKDTRVKTRRQPRFDKLRGRCYRCGDTTHKANNCNHSDSECRKCHKTGHLARVCMAVEADHQKKRNNFIEENGDLHSDDDYQEIKIVQCGQTGKLMLDIQIEKADLRMELDTGAALTSISYKDFVRLKLTNKLYKTKIEMKTYTGEIIKPKGMAFVSCQYKGEKFHGKLYVIDKDVSPIFGREWLREVRPKWQREERKEEKTRKSIREFKKGERVQSRVYGRANNWSFGEVVKRLGLLHYRVKEDGNGRDHQRHLDQLRTTRLKRGESLS